MRTKMPISIILYDISKSDIFSSDIPTGWAVKVIFFSLIRVYVYTMYTFLCPSVPQAYPMNRYGAHTHARAHMRLCVCSCVEYTCSVCKTFSYLSLRNSQRASDGVGWCLMLFWSCAHARVCMCVECRIVIIIIIIFRTQMNVLCAHAYHGHRIVPRVCDRTCTGGP